MNLIQIARICHQANKAYCESINDYTQVDWELAPEWQHESTINRVKFNLDNINSHPKELHENWLREKLENGWKYGKVKNVEKKEHPCFVPYEQLPDSQKLKDLLFKNIVLSFYEEHKMTVNELPHYCYAFPSN
jgi:hypothetical protein